jgi:hypothetical protein
MKFFIGQIEMIGCRKIPTRYAATWIAAKKYRGAMLVIGWASS